MNLAISGVAAACVLAFTLTRSAAPETAAAAPASPGAETYAIDKDHSFIMFRVKHLGVSYAYGRFNDVSGKLVVDEAKPDASSVEIEIKTDSVDTGNQKRDQHLKSGDFFSVKEFPTASFKSKSVKKGAKEWEVAGDLTIKGVTKSVTIPMEHVGSGKNLMGADRIGFEGHVVVKRADYKINFMPDGLGDEVTIKIAVEAAKK